MDPEEHDNSHLLYSIPDDPDGWMPYCDDEMESYPGEVAPDGQDRYDGSYR